MAEQSADWPGDFGFAGGGLPGTLDYQALLEGLAWGGYLAGRDEDQASVVAEQAEAAADGRMRPADPAWVAALAVEHMEPGPALAGWLEVAAGGAGRLDENALAALAIGAQKLASRAQAAGLAACAQISSRAAAADQRIGVAADGRPERLCRDGVAQIALALTLTDHSAGAQADLSVGLGWRLTATRRALTAGVIDYSRARAICEATSVLPAEAARAVEAKLLPEAGRQTLAQLRQRLRLAVIAADPEGAEERRKAAQRHADVRLYGEDDQTATLLADKLPQVEAAAGFARVNALARARVAAGCPGGLRLNRTVVLLGLMLGSLPPMPPSDGAPPDQPPSGEPPSGEPPTDRPPTGEPLSGEPPTDRPPSCVPTHDQPPAPEDLPAPRDEDAPPDDGFDDTPAGEDSGGGHDGDPSQDLAGDDADDDPFGTGPEPAWPSLGAIPPGLARPVRPGPLPDGRPAPGLLDALVPWATLAGLSDRPGLLGRIGPITAAQARQLVDAALAGPATQWRVIVTNAAGQAITVTRIRRRTRDRRVRSRGSRDGPRLGHDGPDSACHGRPPPPGSGLVSRLTLTITEETLRELARAGIRGGGAGIRGGGAGIRGGGAGPAGAMAAAAVKAAARALDRALLQAEADAAAGGCSHHGQSSRYRPPPRLREHVIARDVTCRSPVCRQPAWRSDLDHTIAYDKGGRTCRCNIGGACRRDHQLKQHPRWKLEQTRPGHFTWTTPGGRNYTVEPDIHPV
ncbi:MAG TPA: DUF222 domain-containing protein [Streptosporangiaceae bacterium]|nr:DUF222 domain-containing protein [Streptosporangiaceae bacterium]